MIKNKVVFKRICAYLIDILIVTLISSMFSSIEILNSTNEEYNEVYKEYYNYILENDTSDIIKDDTLSNINYDLQYLNIPSSIISLVVILLYFVVFQYLNKGKTIGKALMKLKVINVNKNTISLLSLFLRYLLLGNIITGVINILILVFCNKEVYLSYYMYIEYIEMFIIIAIYGMFLFRSDSRGLHDIVSNTMVVSSETKIINEVKISKERKIKDEDSSRE